MTKYPMTRVGCFRRLVIGCLIIGYFKKREFGNGFLF
jgi:hypothetical protein